MSYKAENWDALSQEQCFTHTLFFRNLFWNLSLSLYTKLKTYRRALDFLLNGYDSTYDDLPEKA